MNVSTKTRRPGCSPDLVVVIAGLVAGAVGLGIQWMANPETFAQFGFPPGMIYVVGTALIVWLNRRSPWAAAGGVTMGVWIDVGGFGMLQENLSSPKSGFVAGNLLMGFGLAVAAVAGVISIALARRQRPRDEFRPISPHNPRQLAAFVVIAGLVLDFVGDALPEGFRWDGLGPLLFAGLAVAVALVPGRVMTQMAVLICFSFFGGALSASEFMDRLSPAAPTVELVGAILQLVGLGVALLAGLFAVVPKPRTARRGA